MNSGETNSLLDAAVGVFVQIICSDWWAVEGLAKTAHREPAEVLAEWAQANWETVVESSVSPDGKVFIEPYGEGADCNAVGSRVWMPGVASTHAVTCVPRSGDQALDVLVGEYLGFPEGGYPIDRFVALTDEGWYAERPPFDHVLISVSGKDTVFRMSDLRFGLMPSLRG